MCLSFWNCIAQREKWRQFLDDIKYWLVYWYIGFQNRKYKRSDQSEILTENISKYWTIQTANPSFCNGLERCFFSMSDCYCNRINEMLFLVFALLASSAPKKNVWRNLDWLFATFRQFLAIFDRPFGSLRVIAMICWSATCTCAHSKNAIENVENNTAGYCFIDMILWNWFDICNALFSCCFELRKTCSPLPLLLINLLTGNTYDFIILYSEFMICFVSNHMLWPRREKQQKKNPDGKAPSWSPSVNALGWLWSVDFIIRTRANWINASVRCPWQCASPDMKSIQFVLL